jgi:hypothetical protein
MTHLDLVAGHQAFVIDGEAVDQGAVRAAQIAQPQDAGLLIHLGVLACDTPVAVQADDGFGSAADRRGEGARGSVMRKRGWVPVWGSAVDLRGRW